MNTRSPATAGVDQIQPLVSNFHKIPEADVSARFWEAPINKTRARRDDRYILIASPKVKMYLQFLSRFYFKR